MKTLRFLLPAVFLLAPNAAHPQGQREPRRAPEGGPGEMLLGPPRRSLPNAPSTAIMTTEWMREFADATTIPRKNRRAIARDTAGRVFQERRLLVPDDGKHDSPVTQIEISDPISHAFYICVPQELVCQVEIFSAPEPAIPPVSTAERKPGSPAPADLGKQTIRGLETVGARDNMVIPAGAIGNDRPVFTKREFC